MMLRTLRTRPFTITEFQVLLDITTTTTSLAGRKETINLNDLPPIPRRLVCQLSQYLKPRAICDCSCKTVVFHHVLHRQRLHMNDLVFVNQFLSGLVDVIASHIFDLLVDFGEFQTKFLDTLGLLVCCLVSPFAEFPLNLFDFMLQSTIRLDIDVFFAIAVYDQGLDTKINTDFLLTLRQLLNLLINQQRTKVLTTFVLGDCAERDFFFDFSVEDNRDTFQELRYDQFVAFDPYVLWDAEGLFAVFVLELRERCSFLIEVSVGGIEVLDGLLERLRANFREPRCCFLEFGEFFAIFDVVVGTTCGEVFLFTSCKKVVVEVACAAKVFGEQCSLVSGRG